MGKLFNICNVYIVLWIISFFLNSIGASSSVSLLISIPQILITIYCVIMTITQFRVKGGMLYWVFFFALLFIYGAFAVLKSGSTSFFTMVTASIGPLVAFYYFSLKGFITEKYLIFWYVIFIILSTYGYFDNQVKLLHELSRNYNYDEVTNNSSYLFVGLIPFVFLLKDKPILQYGSLAYLLYFSIIGMKRGAIIIAAIMLIWFIVSLTKMVNRNKRIIVVTFSLILIIIGTRFLFQFYNSSDYFQDRVESTMEGESSKRDMIYSSLWNHFMTNSDLTEMFIGGGAFYTQSITGGSNAHNDWLELLIDCGLVGVILYLLFWVHYLKDLRKSKSDFIVYCILVSCFIYFFGRSLVSMGFSNLPFHTSMVMGYCFARLQNRSSEVILNDGQRRTFS